MQLNEHFRFKSRWRPQSNTASVMGLISSSFWKVPVRGFKVECFSPGGYRGERDGERDNGFRGDRGGPRGPRPGDRDREYRGGPRGTGNSGPRGGSGRPYPRSNGFHESGTQWATTSATSDSVKQQIKEETNKTEKALQSVFSIKKSRWKKQRSMKNRCVEKYFTPGEANVHLKKYLFSCSKMNPCFFHTDYFRSKSISFSVPT